MQTRKQCPDCDSYDTERVFADCFTDGVEETRDDRAQLVTPRWLPILLVGVAVAATVLNEAVGPLGEIQSVYAVDTTPQLALLAVAVATVAATKAVGWYRRRGSADQ